jgi:hypothetical protein
MLLNELFEISANPDYLRAAERSRSQARDTQRQYWRSPEEKAAARSTEIKRDKGIGGYTKRHRAANPDMYPTPKAQPAPKLRDPSTEYSDDYSVYAAGRRDTMEQGVAEGSEQDAKFTPRPEIRSRIETQLDQYLDPEKVAGAYTDVQYYKHDSRVYVEVLFHYTDGQKIGPKQRKRFLINKDFTLTPIKGQGVAEGLGKTIKRGMAGWGAFDKDKPADVVKRVRGQDTDTLKGLSNRGSTGKGSPAELQQKAISRELKKRGEQGVAEGGFDDASPMTKDTVKSDRIRSLKNLIAIAKEKGRQLRVQELELELKKLQGGVAEGRTK